MNVDSPNVPRPLPRPKPQTQQQAPGDGTDPAALIAARTAAVARNRQKEARASLIHDLLRIIGVTVLIGGVGWIVHVKHRHGMEEERLRADNEAAARASEQAARKQEQEAAAKRAEESRAAAQAVADEKRRKEEEKRAERERQEKERRQIEANKMSYKTVRGRFSNTTLDLYAAIPRLDRPENATVETTYSCVMPIGSGMAFFEMKALPGKDILVTRLGEEGTKTNIPYAEFSKLAEQNPFLLAKGTYCYYWGRKNWEMRVRVPAANEKLDPSRDDFRDLYDFAKHCGKTPVLAYEVFFIDAGLETRVHVVPFGQTFSRADVKKGLLQIVGSGTAHGRSVGVNDIEARLNKGSLVIRRKKRGTR